MICLVAVGSLSAEEMSETQWLQFNDAVTAMFEELSAGVRSGEMAPIKCATPIFNALISSQPKGVDPKVLFPGRRDDMPFTYPTAHFLLHYTGTGADAIYQFNDQDSMPGVPNFIFNAGRIADSVWNHTVGTLGYTPPISDGYYNGGGDGLLDIYFIDFGAYGATAKDSIKDTFPVVKTTAYIFLENDYDAFPGYESNRLNALRVSIAHEFFHTVQFGIDAIEMEGAYPDWNPAWVEMSAVYMEEEHYEEIDDYHNYLIYFYDVPQWSVRTGSSLLSPMINYWRNLHMYGSAVFPIFLSERFGKDIIRDIWDRCGDVAGPNWWLAVDDAIRNASGDTRTLEDEFQEFALWNLFTRQRAITGSYFPDAADFDSVNLSARITSYPATVSPIDSVLPDNLGANYIILENVASMSTGLAISLNADLAETWGITVVGMQYDIGLPVSIQHIKYDTLSSLIRILDADDYDRIALIVTVLSGNSVQADYSLTVTSGVEGVQQPNGGEILYAGVQYDVRWYFETADDSVTIEYSLDDGFSWNHLADTENDLAYEWMVPDTPSDSCLVRVSNYPSLDPSDVSDSVFAIKTTTGNKVHEPFPNPAWPEKHNVMYFKGEYIVSPLIGEAAMKVTIMTVAGEKLRELNKTSSSGAVVIEWDFTNDDGRTVAAGLYLAVIDFQDETVVKKFVILR